MSTSPGAIHFICPSCQVRLTVPEAMAGVSGPCPRCAATIQAPMPAARVLAPLDAPRPSSPLQTPPPEARASPPAVHDPHPIRPEPRQLPDRRLAPNIARNTTSDSSLRRNTVATRRPKHSPVSSVGRILLPSLMAGISAAVVYLLLYHFLPGGPGRRLEAASRPLVIPKLQPAGNPPAAPSAAGHPAAVETAETALGFPTMASGEAHGLQAGRILDQFLAATRLSERIELLEPEPDDEKIAATPLAGPLPRVTNITSDLPARNELEGFTDFPYRVTFVGGEGSYVDHTIVVRSRDRQTPKILSEPFLDLMGGRLASFAATPVQGRPTFQAVIEPIPRCFDDSVPDAARKFTYKLSSSTVGKEVARAYASLTSPLAEQLYSNSGIQFGTPVRATFTLEWNHQEDPARPYLEMIEIKALDWGS